MTDVERSARSNCRVFALKYARFKAYKKLLDDTHHLSSWSPSAGRIMGFFYVYRNLVLGLCLILTIPCLGLLAHWTQGTELDHKTLAFEGMGLFVSILSFILLPVMYVSRIQHRDLVRPTNVFTVPRLVLSEFRKNAFILYILSELIIVALLWIFWMTAAILVVEEIQVQYPSGDCGLVNKVFPGQGHWCFEIMAIQGLSITIFVFLLKYLIVLLIFAFIRHSRGQLVWLRSVKEVQVTLPKVKLSHEPGELDANGNPIGAQPGTGSLFGAPNTYPPQTTNSSASEQGYYNPNNPGAGQQQVQQQPQPQPTYASMPSAPQLQQQHQQYQQQNTTSAVQMQSTGQSQVTHSISYSRPQPPPQGAQYPSSQPYVAQV
ncbi:hypothetical protein D9613_006315 [Agrocybe pediades]|uniref:Uncharacterized protein n=1 Tax=Agrocybe pediades TaxID=84607 RepID=A0A8H4QUE1_9AGAR|nr:hypothetical protein D9613_006315 [Agrocybe pediades]